MAAACSALQQAENRLSTLASHGVNILVAGVDHFFDRVLVARVDRSPALEEYARAIQSLLNVFIADNKDFNPHVTILKLTHENDRIVGSKTVPPWLYSEFKNKNFGKQPVSTIDLCAMSHYIERPAGDFYVTPLHMDLM